MKIFVSGDIVISKTRNKIVDSMLNALIEECDISICNFEAPVESSGQAIPKAGPHLNQTIESVELIKETGFNVCSLANNHIYDYGDVGLRETLDIITKNELESIGAGMDFNSAYKPLIKVVNDVKIGLLSLCESEFGSLLDNENRGGYGYINHLNVNDIIRKIRDEVDCLILIAHGGVEEVPLPLPQWRERYRNLCDQGVDFVIGHHPHVPQGYEKYKNSMIFYSLGNFFMDSGDFENKLNYGYSVILDISKEKNDFKLVPHYTKNNFVQICNEDEYTEYLKKLNEWLEKDYELLSNQQALYLYSTRYRKYYCSATGAIHLQMNFLEKITNILSQLIMSEKNTEFRELLMLHNIRIDSHRYSTQHALSLLCEKKQECNYNLFEKIISDNKKYLGFDDV
ncbi:CapA family protein [Methanolobus vulcani]|uniref:CapA family protein n=1 Tax=Methanolobus vulcani TaxID=38026 RepID=A0A7Z8P1J3_9EURY|nr:CapA family protein [Methanolobus vulcani]TQD23851.1 CapA family protein [Methanolobus vulcani]